MNYQLVIGLEIHLKLNSDTKLFCSCANIQDVIQTTPNTHICPVCSAQPGALPVLQPWPVSKSLLLARALWCRVQNPSTFDRKSYFYADLPMGYQITQFFTPYAVEGQVSFFDETYSTATTINIHEAHMETDTAKTIHDGDDSFVDFNRAGTPLVEIVTQPDFRTAQQVIDFLKEIQRIAQFNNIADADLEKWQMRVDVNMSIRPTDSDPYGTRVEIKNINTFSNIRAAIDAEYARQVQIISSWETLDQETRRRDATTGTTISMRSKEDALDYRYFPEPDLPPLLISAEQLAASQDHELIIPAHAVEVYTHSYGFHKEYINVLLADRVSHDFFVELVDRGHEPKTIAKWMAGPLVSYCNEHYTTMDQLPISLEQVDSFLSLLSEQSLNNNQAKIVIKDMLASGENPDVIIARHGFDQAGMSDDDLTRIVQEVVDAHPDAVADYQWGKQSAIKFLLGQVMRQTRGQAGHQQVEWILLHLLW